jgi:hypothetical protein
VRCALHPPPPQSQEPRGPLLAAAGAFLYGLQSIFLGMCEALQFVQSKRTSSALHRCADSARADFCRLQTPARPGRCWGCSSSRPRRVRNISPRQRWQWLHAATSRWRCVIGLRVNGFETAWGGGGLSYGRVKRNTRTGPCVCVKETDLVSRQRDINLHSLAR